MARHRSFAVPLALLFAALIVYASLYPFEGWRPPGTPLLSFLNLPWPPYWTVFDLAANLLGYAPLGALTMVALVRSGWRFAGAFAMAALCGGALSLALEVLQNFLPNRVPSNVDWALNSAGALLGAGLAAPLLASGVARWQTLRDRWFAERSAGGLTLLLLWPISLLFPLPLPLAVGRVLQSAGEALAGWLDGTAAAPWWPLPAAGDVPAGLMPEAEFALTLLGQLAPCLLAFAVSPPSWRRLLLVTAAVVVGLSATALSTALNFSPQHAFAWATPRTLSAVGAAWLVAALLAWLPRRACAALGLLALAALVVMVNQTPADPYFAQSLRAWEQGRFIHFHGGAQWVGWLWPYVAMAYLLTLLRRPEG